MNKNDLKLINACLVKSLKGKIKLSTKNSYLTNIVESVRYFYDHIGELLGCFSLETYDFVKEALESDKPFVFNENHLYREDFSLLMEMGVFDMIGGTGITLEYQPLLKEAFKVKDIEEPIYLATFIKGLIDLYGYLDMKSLKEIVSKHFIPNDRKDFLYDFMQSSLLITSKAVIKKTYVIRKDIYKDKEKFLSLRQEYEDNISILKKGYKPFEEEEILNFSSTFSLSGNFQINDMVVLTNFLEKTFSISPITYPPEECEDQIKIEIAQINHAYPKWLFKGYSIDEVDAQLQYDNMIQNSIQA